MLTPARERWLCRPVLSPTGLRRAVFLLALWSLAAMFAACGKKHNGGGAALPPPPTVSAGPDVAGTVGNAVALNGTVTDDGLPEGRAVTSTWSKVSGPGNVAFANANAASTTATFDTAGTYVVRLSASDGALSASDDATVTITAPGVNQAPVVSAGPDVPGTVGNAVALNGSATDDGLPAGSTVTVTWSKLSGPGNVAFANANAAATTATFDAAGTYELRLAASDGTLEGTDDVSVTITVPAQNQAPQVSAGPDVTGTTGQAVALNGSVTDDGLPAARAVTVTWSKVSGPGNVAFANANAAATTATFDADGSYVVQLTASDGALSASDDATVTINPLVRTMSIQGGSGAPGTEVTVQILLNDVANIGGFKAALRWDTSQLSLVAGSVTPGTALNGASFANINTATAGELIVNHTGTSQYAATGQLATLRFTVANGLTAGTALPLTLLSEAAPSVKRSLVYTLDASTLTPALVNGAVTVN